ncbi:MAG TPA: hypothetical protein VLG46_08170 [Anaerolineae bacterium]|nr:hypothetical protein [Anaerolineae bacterium]
MDKRVALILVMNVILGGCWAADVTHFSGDSANAVMKYVRESDPTATFADAFTLACTVSEGSFCDVEEPAVAQAALSRDLSKQIIKDLDPKSVEHAQYNTVYIHCEQRTEGPLRKWKCEIDGGGGWQSLPVP